MKEVFRASLLGFLFSAAGLALVMQPVLAEPVGECRQEAESYGIPPEQFQDYVDGCVLSRGGHLPDAGSLNEAAPAVDGEHVTGAPDDMTLQDNSGVEGIPDGAQKRIGKTGQ